jgi:hypothetical protein
MKEVDVVTDAVALPVVTGVTAPTPGLMESEVAPATAQARVTVPPPMGRLAGVAVKLVMLGFAALPPELQAERTNPATSRNVQDFALPIVSPFGDASDFRASCPNTSPHFHTVRAGYSSAP